MRLVLNNIVLPLARFNLELDLEIRSRVTAIFGPSGAGKTSLLDILAGLRHARSAIIQLNNVTLCDTSKGIFVPARQRNLGYLPQDLALFPHLSVRQNLLYGYQARESKNPLLKFDPIVELLEIESLIPRRIEGLSGGEKQRVALARALLTSPDLLLLDEPLANLDMKLKARIMPYLIRIRDEFHIPMLYITHDRSEALSIADETVVLLQGQVAQIGPTREVFTRPANLDVASLVTVETIQPGRVIKTENHLVTVEVGTTLVSAMEPEFPTHAREVLVCIRAEDVILVKGASTPSSARNRLPGTVRSIAREGQLMRVDLDCGFPLTTLLTHAACEELALREHDAILALVKAPNVHLIPR